MLKLRGLYRWCKSNLFPQPHPILQINKLWPRSLNFSEEATLLARVPDLEPRYGTRVLWKAWCFYSPFIPIHLDFIIISLYLFHSQLFWLQETEIAQSQVERIWGSHRSKEQQALPDIMETGSADLKALLPLTGLVVLHLWFPLKCPHICLT